MTDRGHMERPPNVPAAAEWSEEDDEWVLGTRDADGEYHGELHYWRPDGTLVSIAHQHHGEWDGECTRFHPNGEPSQIDHYDRGVLHGLRTWIACEEPTTERMHTPQMSADIWRSEVMYERGRPTKFRWYLRDGTEVEMDGSVVAVRPDGVPEGAVFNKRNNCWIDGTWDEHGKRDGVMRVYRADGSLLSVEHYVEDVADGPHDVFYEDGTLRMRRHLADGEVTGEAEFFHRSGGRARHGVLRDGIWAGALTSYDESGTWIGESIAAVLEAAAGTATVGADEAAFLAQFGVESQAAVQLSAAGLARAIAIGWGGDYDRPARRARAARAFVRSQPALSDVLAATGLDTAPRLLTAARLERLCVLCEGTDEVDHVALRAALADEGGVGATAALASGGLRAVEFLRGRIANNRLDLQHMGLEELPETIRYLSTLTKLEVSHNAISEVPAWLADLAFLRQLRLTGNRVSALPDELRWMTELRALYLADNGMELVPGVVTELPELETLNLGDNELEELPAAFGELPRLDHLWLHGNPLQTLPDSFGKLPLTFLHLGDLPWREPPPCIWELEELKSLWLASPSLERLPADVANLPNLKKLMVWYSNLTEVPDVLFEMTQLEELRIGHNPLEDGTIDALKEALPDCTIY